MGKKPKTKKEIEADIKAILAKDARYTDAKVFINFIDKKAIKPLQDMNKQNKKGQKDDKNNKQ